jgi:translation initiation factor IF-2
MEARKQEEIEKRKAERAERRQRQQARQTPSRDHRPTDAERTNLTEGGSRPAQGDRPNPQNRQTQGNRPNQQNRPAQGNRPGQPNRPGQQNRPGQPNRPGQQNRPGQPNRPGQQNRPAGSGPRTSMRRGLTPAQIAASKAPSSSLKQIEKKISDERAERRREQAVQRRRSNTSGDSRPGQDRSPSGATIGQRRASSAVSITPSEPFPPADGVKKRPFGGPGQQQQRGKRRLTPAEKAARRSYSAKRNAVFTDEQEERMARLARGDRRRSGVTKDDEDFVIREVEVTDPIMVSELASRMAVKTGELIKRLFEMGTVLTANASLDGETAVLMVEEFGHRPKLINEAAVEDVLIDQPEEHEEELEPRPPVVVVMGHVDHGKTSILDALRKASVAEGEAGGITQHIGAYMVKLEDGERVVFIDTPGHQAFTGLRARGAKLTDVAVLVVAADDGVMPQTVEALNHAKAAGVPIIVAINKMDKEGADPERVMRQLAEHELLPEEWGGDTIFVKVSAHTGEGLDDLLEMLALQTEVLELKANPNRAGRGVIVESSLDRGRGRVATVLVQNGTFKKGDIVVVGSVMGRVRAIVDENSVQHRTAGPSIPFELLGLEDTPEAGSEVVVVESERQAREIVSYRKEKERSQGALLHKRASMDELFAAVQSGVIEVPIILKSDVTGTLEALADSMNKLGNEEVKVKLVLKGIGGITESDVMLAAASNAIIIGYNVRPEAKAKQLATAEGVDIRFYRVIYEALEEITAALAGKLAPTKVEKVIGSAEVREVFQVPKIGAVAGSYMTDGFVTRNAHVRVLRDSVVRFEGVLASLRRFKDDVKEVKAGYECGIGVDKFNDIKSGDTFEFFIIEEIAATL